MFYNLPLSKDTFITNISTDGTSISRATGSCLGSSPVLEIFALKSRLSTGSVEWSRVLLQFDVTDLSRSIFVDKTIPSSSISYTLRMPNYVHGGTIPTSFELYAYPVSGSWVEGTGSDVSNWRDFGYANWMSASSTRTWTNSGSDFLTAGYGSGSQLFDRGQEDLEMNVTEVVGNWLSSSIGVAGLPNNGLVIKLGTTEENNGTNYDIKMFHSRESKYVDRLPYLQARWDSDVLRDDRNNVAYNTTNRLYFYNFVRGQLTGASEPVVVQIKDHIKNISASFNLQITASRVAEGIYSASFSVNSFTASFSSSWVDVWYSGSVSGSTLVTGSCYMTGTFTPVFLSGSSVDPYEDFVIDVTNLKGEYLTTEQARIKVDVRKKNLKKSHIRVVHTGSTNIDREYVREMYYSVVNDVSNELIVPFGTGSVQFTRLSYNGEGNYFDMFFNGYVPGFMYRLKFLIIDNKRKVVIDDVARFKIV